MPFPVALMLALAAASSVAKIHQARQTGKAIVKQGALEATRRKHQIIAKAAKQKTSFLSSGLTLQGTPQSVLESTFTIGKQDVEQGISTANTQARNVLRSAQVEAIGSLAMAGAGAGFGGGTESLAQETAFSGITKTGVASTATPFGDPFSGGSTLDLFKKTNRSIF